MDPARKRRRWPRSCQQSRSSKGERKLKSKKEATSNHPPRRAATSSSSSGEGATDAPSTEPMPHKSRSMAAGTMEVLDERALRPQRSLQHQRDHGMDPTCRDQGEEEERKANRSAEPSRVDNNTPGLMLSQSHNKPRKSCPPSPRIRPNRSTTTRATKPFRPKLRGRDCASGTFPLDPRPDRHLHRVPKKQDRRARALRDDPGRAHERCVLPGILSKHGTKPCPT